MKLKIKANQKTAIYFFLVLQVAETEVKLSKVNLQGPGKADKKTSDGFLVASTKHMYNLSSLVIYLPEVPRLGS